MTISSEQNFFSNIKFFDLLLEQFRGSEGEIAMATVYLTQAITDGSPQRKAVLNRIAREKLKHAEMLGAILLQMANGVSGPLPLRVNRDELTAFLNQQGLKKNSLAVAEDSLSAGPEVKSGLGNPRHHAENAKQYLSANITTEVVQIAVYEELVGLTKNATFISALNYAKARQVLHRDEFVDLLRRIDQ